MLFKLVQFAQKYF